MQATRKRGGTNPRKAMKGYKKKGMKKGSKKKK